VADFDAVLFDFGGVLTPSPIHGLRQAAHDLGIPPDVAFAAVFGGYDEDTDHPWHRLERGEVSIEDALAAIATLAGKAGYDLDPIALLTSGMGGSLIRDDVVDLVREVRGAGLRTAIVTNNIREFGDTWRAMLPVAELFDVVVDSCEEGVRKPDPRIFHIALERLGGIAPERAVFLDDAPGSARPCRRGAPHPPRRLTRVEGSPATAPVAWRVTFPLLLGACSHAHA
jgi:putative hydrolase of the HAD superfamily